MKTAVFFFAVVNVLVTDHLFAQSVTDTVMLNDVTILSSDEKNVAQHPDQPLFDQNRNRDLGDFLSRVSGYNIRQYSPGGSSTVAPRGYSPEQVSIKWNGVDITNPMLGQTDLSLMPVLFFDAVQLTTNPNVSDNAPAGSINLRQSFINNGVQLSSYHSWSSLQNITNSLAVKTGGKHWHTAWNFLNDQNKNTFTYHNHWLTNDSLLKIRHADAKNIGSSFNVEHTFGKHTLEAGGYLFHAQRLIPPTMLQTEGLDEQTDQTSASFIRYENKAKTSVIADVSAVFHAIEFYDGLLMINYDSHSSVYRSSVTVTRKIALVDVTAALQTARFEATVLPNVYKRSEWQHGIRIGAIRTFKALHMQFGLEGMQRFRNSDVLPLNHTATILFFPSSRLQIKLTEARIGRLPGLNDRYWNPGGNPDLKSENAWRNNINIVYNSVLSRDVHAEISCDVHYDNVNDWIQWTPTGGYWSPSNVKSVLLYGVAPAVTFRYFHNKLEATLNAGYSLTHAITTSSFLQNDASVGKQLMYVPLQTFHGHLIVATQHSSAYILFNGYDARYTQSDNTDWLNGYATFDAGVSHTLVFGSLSLTLSGKVENITGTDYQTIIWHAMPRQVFSFALSLQYILRQESISKSLQ